MLLDGKRSVLKTHYDILSVKEDADYEEIHKLQESSLKSHPDKKKATKSRDTETAEDVSFEEMMVEEVGQVLNSLQCRCAIAFPLIQLNSERWAIHWVGMSKIFIHKPDSIPATVILPLWSSLLKFVLQSPLVHSHFLFL
ncbi:hypothetical protein MKW92_005363 [Papaver armeniacum]|nr:hypothetical protein MKW92_005363 [Papaver armeniacum]